MVEARHRRPRWTHLSWKREFGRWKRLLLAVNEFQGQDLPRGPAQPVVGRLGHAEVVLAVFRVVVITACRTYHRILNHPTARQCHRPAALWFRTNQPRPGMPQIELVPHAAA